MSIHSTDKKLNFVQRLQQAINLWKRHVEPALKKRKTMLSAWSAGYYHNNQSQPHPLNMIDRGLGILIPYLVMSNPKIQVSTNKLELRPFALTMELAFNHFLDEVRFASNTLRPAVRDSLLGMGIVKVGISKEWEVEIQGYLHDVGQVYADVVDIEDYIGDPAARSFEGFEFEGHLYRMPLDIAKEMYPKHADRIRSVFHLYGDELSTDQVTKKSLNNEQYYALKEYTELADIWLPDENVIITINPHDSRGKVLRTVEWDGPEGGPFEKLFYQQMPNTALPLPPVWSWLDMDTAINVIVNKIRRQIELQKSVLVYEGEAFEDAQNLANAPDRTTVKVQHREGVQMMEFPGIDRGAYDWLHYLESQFSTQGQNLYTIGGRNAQAGTLGQEQMLMANASKSVDDMAQRVYEFTSRIARKVIWFLWNDPLVQIPAIKRIEGYGPIEVMFDKTSREGDFLDYNFDVEPYSLQRLSPTLEYQRLITLLSQWVLPTAQIAASQGAQIDVPEATRQLARQLQIRGFSNWYKYADPSEVALNPYNPQFGSPKNKAVADGRTGMLGAESRLQNLVQQQTQAGSPE